MSYDGDWGAKQLRAIGMSLVSAARRDVRSTVYFRAVGCAVSAFIPINFNTVRWYCIVRSCAWLFLDAKDCELGEQVPVAIFITPKYR